MRWIILSHDAGTRECGRIMSMTTPEPDRLYPLPEGKEIVASLGETTQVGAIETGISPGDKGGVSSFFFQ